MKGTKVELLVGGDFNRYDQFWDGDRIAKSSRQGEGARLVDWMMEKDLQLLLPQGTPKYESYDEMNASTIDLLFTSEDLTNLLTSCGILITDHGSNHRAKKVCLKIVLTKAQPLQDDVYIKKKTRMRSNPVLSNACLRFKPLKQITTSRNIARNC